MMEGRFPSHLLLSHSIDCTAEACVAGCPVKALDEQSGIRAKGAWPKKINSFGYRRTIDGGKSSGVEIPERIESSEGGASRYFKQFRPSPSNPRGALLQYLTRLITPPGGIVLDPLGNNEDLQNACQDEGFSFIGIVAEEEG